MALELGVEGPRVVPGAISFRDGELRDGHDYALTRDACGAPPRALSAFDALDDHSCELRGPRRARLRLTLGTGEGNAGTTIHSLFSALTS